MKKEAEIKMGNERGKGERGTSKSETYRCSWEQTGLPTYKDLSIVKTITSYMA